MAPLNDDNRNYGSWINKRGEKEIYFSGSNSGVHTCECGLNDNCIKDHLKCDCDANDATWDYDEGNITDMNALPILGFNYYGLTYESEKGSISYGPLQCSGMKDISPGKSCYDLKLQGETLSGYYQVSSNINQGQGPMHQTVYCDFTQSLQSTNLQQNVLPPIKYEVFYWNKAGEHVFGPNRILNYHGYNFQYGSSTPLVDLSTGMFTAPKSGMYKFYLHGMTSWYISYTRVEFKVNGNIIEDMYSNSMIHDGNQSGHIPMHFQVHVMLAKGDQVHINLGYGGFWVHGSGIHIYKIHFGGELLYLS